MYYSEKYIQEELERFSEKSGTAFFNEKSVRKFLEIEGKFAKEISNVFFARQLKRFPSLMIRSFLDIFPKLARGGARYTLEREHLLEGMDRNLYLYGAEKREEKMFGYYYRKAFDLGGETALSDIKSSMQKNGNKEVQRLGEKINPSFELKDLGVREELDNRAGRQITRVNETTRRLIINTIIQAYDTGGGYNEIKSAIENLFATWKVPNSGNWFTNKRAEMIARTELANAVTWARRACYERRGIDKESWMSEPDACERCLMASGDGVIAMTALFSNGMLQPSAHPNCRCALVPELTETDSVKGYTWHGEELTNVHSQD